MNSNLQYMPLAAILLLFGSCAAISHRSHTEEMKFHPGHYVAVGPLTELSKIKHLDEPTVRGVNKRYFWRTLEPEPGVYDFSEIENDLASLAQHGKQLVIFLMDKTFSQKSPLPRYLAAYEFDSDYDGFTPARWHPYYIKRILALGEALAERFDVHPNFEGLAVQESSLGITPEGVDIFGYTPEKYRDALIAILNGLQHSLPKSHVFWYSNFLHGNNGYLRRVADAMEKSGVLMGGPDILPYRRGVNKASYPMYKEYKDKLSLFCSAQGDSYRHHKNDTSVDEEEPVHSDGYLSMEEIFLFARDTLHVRYLFWDYEYGLSEPGARTYDDAIEVIRKYPTFNETVGPLAGFEGR